MKKRLTATLILVCVMSGCSAPQTRQGEQAKSTQASPGSTQYPPQLSANSQYVIDRYRGGILAWNPKNGAVSDDAANSQTFDYFPQTPSPSYYTRGSSSGSPNFTIYDLSPSRTTPVASAPAGLFPVAADDSKNYFLLIDYGTDNKPTGASLAILSGGHLKTLGRLGGAASSALIQSGHVWYTLLDPDGETYSLWRANPDGKNATKERKGIRSSVILPWRGKVVTDGTFGRFSVDCSIYCATDEPSGLVYSITQSDNALNVTRLATTTGVKAVVATGDILDVIPRSGGAQVFLRSGLKTIGAGA